MSHFNPNQHFDVENWRDQQIAQRTKDALAVRDAAFAEKNAGTTRAALAQYLSVCAAALGHSPSPTEIDGGAFIEQCFGSWETAMDGGRLTCTQDDAETEQHPALQTGKGGTETAVPCRACREEAAEAGGQEPPTRSADARESCEA